MKKDLQKEQKNGSGKQSKHTSPNFLSKVSTNMISLFRRNKSEAPAVKKVISKRKRSDDDDILTSYKHLIPAFAKDFQEEKAVIQSLETHLKQMEQLDVGLSGKINGLWLNLAPKVRVSLTDIKEKIYEQKIRIAELGQEQEKCDDFLKSKYVNLIRIAQDNERQWRNIGIVIITKVVALQEVSSAITDLQNLNKSSTSKVYKMIHDYKVYKHNVEKVLKDCRAVRDYGIQVQQEIDDLIADISPHLLELVNQKIVQNMKAITMRAEILFDEAASFDIFEKPVIELGKMKDTHTQILESFQKSKMNTLDLDLGLEKISFEPEQLEDKIEEIFGMLQSKCPDKNHKISTSDKNNINVTTNSPKEIGRDGSFIAYDNGTVLDIRTGLMWASRDNGKDINWNDAKQFCENYRGGGYRDWRLPTLDELAGLYDSNSSDYKIIKYIQLTSCCPWASERKEGSAGFFNFANGNRYWFHPSNDDYKRALPVRASK